MGRARRNVYARPRRRRSGDSHRSQKARERGSADSGSGTGERPGDGALTSVSEERVAPAWRVTACRKASRKAYFTRKARPGHDLKAALSEMPFFHVEFREDIRYWVRTDRSVALRVLQLVETVIRDPFAGIGKPEPLKHLLAGGWSRRVTQEHRLVHRVGEKRIDFLQARYHY
jgi:toxin YoeB